MNEADTATPFGKWLSRQRKARDLTQEDLAERVGCAVWSIQKIEAGSRLPSKQVAELLADYFGISPTEREAFLLFARGRSEAWDNSSLSSRSPRHMTEESQPKVGTLNNLPMQLTSFVGRVVELPRIRDLMLTSEVRLLTLTGPPGTGKTRLTLQVAAELLKEEEFVDGIFFVNLAPISDPDLVVSEIAQTLGIGDSGTRSLFETVQEYLRDKRLLLVLDNFEQVVAAAPQVAELLTRTQRLKVLATSRVPLHVRGEKEFAIPPLQLPDLEHLPPPDQLGRYEAVQLFVQRSSDVSALFEMTGDNASAVAHICASLDGLPLAIELAAARVKVLSPQVILTRLESRLRLLTGGPRDLPARQRTLRGAIEWSYDLLDEEEKTLFRRLGVFVGGFTLEAVEAVCAEVSGDPRAGMPSQFGPGQFDVLEEVADLVDKSLLRQQEGVGREPRFTMLETIREYSRDKLHASGEEQVVKRTHALYFAGLAEEAEIWGSRLVERDWLDRLEEENDNMRAALQWSHSAEGDIEIELRLAAALGPFWYVRSYISEGRERIALALSASAPLWDEVAVEQGVKKLRGRVLVQAGDLAFLQADYAAARAALEDARDLFLEIGDRHGLADALHNLGDTAREVGDYDTSALLFDQSLAIVRELGDSYGAMVVLALMSWGEMRLGSYANATAHLQESLEIARQEQNTYHIARALFGLGEVMVLQGEYEKAAPLLEESLAIRRVIGEPWSTAVSLGALGRLALREGDLERASTMLAESFVLRQEIRDKGGIAWCLEKFGQIESIDGNPQRAARLLGAAEVLREALGTAVDSMDQAEYDQAVSIVRNCLDKDGFAIAWQEGRAMSMEEAVAYALEES